MKLTKIALGVALAAGTVAAQAADILWFPHVVHSGYVTTVLTVIETAGTTYTDPKPHHMHYVYKLAMNGETADDINAKVCEESDGVYPMSKYDVQSFDVGGVVSTNDEGVLFGDPGINNAWAGSDYRRSKHAVDVTGALGSRGYWVVEDSDAAMGALEGYATVFDYKNGSAWGYKAEEFTGAAHAPVPFSAHMMPPVETVSRLLITPFIGGAPGPMIPASASYVNDLTTGITAVSLIGSRTVVDRDENVDSGTQSKNVTCVGTVDILSLISASTQKHVENGGWLKIQTVGGGSGTPTADAVVYQLDFGGAGATNSKFNGFGYPGTWNNLIVRQ